MPALEVQKLVKTSKLFILNRIEILRLPLSIVTFLLAVASLLGTTAARAQSGTPQSPYLTTSAPISQGLGNASYGVRLDANNFARQNTISNCTYGVYGGTYQDNLTGGCANP